MVTIHEVKQNTEAWHKLREDVAWTGSTIIYLLKGKKRPERSNYTSGAMERGKALEPQALMAYKLETDREYIEVGFVTNSDYPTCGYSPDGVSGEVLLEVKCFNPERHQALLDGNIPAEVTAQIQFGMLICEMEKAVLIAYNPHYDGQQLGIIEIARDEKIIANMEKKLNG